MKGAQSRSIGENGIHCILSPKEVYRHYSVYRRGVFMVVFRVYFVSEIWKVKEINCTIHSILVFFNMEYRIVTRNSNILFMIIPHVILNYTAFKVLFCQETRMGI